MHNFIRDFFYSIFPNVTKYLDFKRGESNIVLSAPHGGDIRPINIPYRTRGNRSKDLYTRRLIQRVIELLDNKPYYIYADIHRSRVDLNRDLEEATDGNKLADRIWRDWNYLLDSHLNEVRYFYDKGLYIDIHSYNNSDEFQIGYGLSVKDYLNLLNDNQIPTKKSTMHSLKEYLPDSYKSEHSILFGPDSIPYSLEKFGYKVLVPANEDNYLNGGYNIREFKGNGIGAMQIECPISVLRKDLFGVAIALTKSIETFSKRFLVAN